jgi:hypothetical protein
LTCSDRLDRTYRQIIVSNFLPEGTQEEWRVFDELQRRTTSPENAWRFVNEFADIDVTDLAPRVTVPTLVIGGRRDRVGPFQQSRLMAGLIPRSRLVPLDTPNHLLPEQDPAWPEVPCRTRRIPISTAATTSGQCLPRPMTSVVSHRRPAGDEDVQPSDHVNVEESRRL